MKNDKKILIVEDELLIAKVMSMQFEKRGFKVIHVQDADKAVEMAKQMHPDIIIMDVYLQNKTSGIDASVKIREAGINTPIIFTTGNSYLNTVDNVTNISNSKVLSKPIDFEQLLLEVNKI